MQDPQQLIQFHVETDSDRSIHEVVAAAVAYVFGRYCGLDTSGSPFTIAA